MQERAFADPKLEIVWNSEVAEINGDDRLEGVTLRDTVTGETSDLAATGLFIAIGHDPRSELLHGQVDLDDERLRAGRAPVDRAPTCPASSRRRPGRPPLPPGVTAAGTGCAAALDAERYLAALDHDASTAGDARRHRGGRRGRADRRRLTDARPPAAGTSVGAAGVH